MSSLPISGVFNDSYVADAYDRYVQDPSSVDESWRQFFRLAESFGGGGSRSTEAATSPAQLRAAAAAASLADAIRAFGHMAVQLDPLGAPPPGARELHAEFYGVAEADLAGIPAAALGWDGDGTAADVIQHLRDSYCAALGWELQHVGDDTERQWLRQRIESGDAVAPLSDEDKRQLLSRLVSVDALERFVGRAYVSMKRFSIEGVDVLVPLLEEAISIGARDGASRVVFGMAHRGRLNVLVHVMGKPYEDLLEQFEGRHAPAPSEIVTADVKYHLGYRGAREIDGRRIELELVPNPSHLEVVNPVAMGVARARQTVDGGAPNERDESAVLPVVVHGDASFPGEGVVPETMNLALLRGYRVGGSIHIIANNQVGFTTDPIDARSTRYASDLAKGFEMPIVHVNADDAESCIQAMRTALAYRKRFGKDFVIDVVGYRRHGHNEADQPAFTQPSMYKAIEQHPTPAEVFSARLVRERVVTEEQATTMPKAVTDSLQNLYEGIKKNGPAAHAAHPTPVTPAGGVPSSGDPQTAVRAERLVSLNEQLLSWPSTFTLHPTIQRTLPRRRDALQNGGIDWGHAESLAFASLITDGTSVRMTGQDVERGTFSHRHAVLHDQPTGETYTPLANLPQAKASFEIHNSPLSETAVMAFEYGYSTASPSSLVLWEAQFGDFANVAQPIIDQFLSADHAKWNQDSGLVLLLPHGYEGQGPEHSSARLERFLQLFAEGNMTVAYPSTPAQYFHILRRQAMRSLKRPLVLMQPKSLLRLPAAASKLADLTDVGFQRVIDDPQASANRDAVQRLVFCTGKIYYDVAEKERPANVAIARIEELAPWPREVADVMDLYPNVDEVVWLQEEPKNMGAWTYVQPRLRASIGTIPLLRYIGRPERASPAEGYQSDHQMEQERIVTAALSYAPANRKKAGAAR